MAIRRHTSTNAARVFVLLHRTTNESNESQRNNAARTTLDLKIASQLEYSNGTMHPYQCVDTRTVSRRTRTSDKRVFVLQCQTSSERNESHSPSSVSLYATLRAWAASARVTALFLLPAPSITPHPSPHHPTPHITFTPHPSPITMTFPSRSLHHHDIPSRSLHHPTPITIPSYIPFLNCFPSTLILPSISPPRAPNTSPQNRKESGLEEIGWWVVE